LRAGSPKEKEDCKVQNTTNQILSVTVEDVLAWEPCGPDEDQIRALASARERWTARDVLREARISPGDRLWVVTRPELLADRVMHEFGCRCAERVLPIYERRYPEDQRLRTAIDTKRRWVRGEVSDEHLDITRAYANLAVLDTEWSSPKEEVLPSGLRRRVRKHGASASEAAVWSAARSAVMASDPDPLEAGVRGSDLAVEATAWATEAEITRAELATELIGHRVFEREREWQVQCLLDILAEGEHA
jgi:hypothetical protein